MSQENSRDIVLLSLHPEHAEAILYGSKTIEFRRRAFAPSVKRAYIYATKPTSMVIGRIDIVGYETASRNEIWRKYNGRGGITKAQFFRYFADVEYAVALRVSKPRRMLRNVELAQLSEAKAVPQSFRYLGDADVRILERAMRR